MWVSALSQFDLPRLELCQRVQSARPCLSPLRYRLLFLKVHISSFCRRRRTATSYWGAHRCRGRLERTRRSTSANSTASRRHQRTRRCGCRSRSWRVPSRSADPHGGDSSTHGVHGGQKSLLTSTCGLRLQNISTCVFEQASKQTTSSYERHPAQGLRSGEHHTSGRWTGDGGTSS